MNTPDRSRVARQTLLAAVIASLLPRPSFAADKIVRIGVQKCGTLIIMRERKVLEQVLSPLGWSVRLNFGTTVEAPPIFAQAAIADTFFKLRFIPQKLDVASAVWSSRS